MRIARIVEAVPPSGIRRFFDVVARMHDVISLGVGEPDFVTPWRIREAAIYSIERGLTQYTSNAGLLELRQGIARYLDESYGVEYRPEGEVLVTVGVSEALDIALRAILEPGDEVIIPEPCYVSYSPCTMLAGGTPVPVATHASSGFHIQPAALEAAVTPRSKAIILNFPNNPSGVTLRKPDLEQIADIARRRDLLVMSDEIYGELTYDHPHVCLASLPGMQERTLLLNGFSKAFAMTGWRVGYAAGPSEWIGAMTKIHQYTMLCAPMTSQQAAIEALKDVKREVPEMVSDYCRRGRWLASAFAEMGLSCAFPEGAFYLFPDIRSSGLSSVEFAERLLAEERVAVVPGNAFGQCGEGHVRCSYATGTEQLNEAARRIGRFLQRRRSSAKSEDLAVSAR